MIRFLATASFVILFLVLGSPLLLAEYIIGKFNPEKMSRSSLKIVQWAFRSVLVLSGTELTVIGRENIPEDQPVLYVGNHRSYFDIVIGYTLIKRECGFIAKKEMERYPLLSDWMRNLHCQFLDRDNLKEGLKTILAAIDCVKQGVSIWIFPEGTRSREEGMLPFKDGSFKIAEKSGCPIVPVAMHRTADIFENHFPRMKKTQVTVEFGKPVPTAELSKEEKKELSKKVRTIIQKMLDNEPSASTETA